MKVDIKTQVLLRNDREAKEIFDEFEKRGVKAVNVMASPGAGKTTLILSLLRALPDSLYKGVIEGDVASSIDTEKIRAEGFKAVQINTAGACHLNSGMIKKALKELDPKGPGIVFIENIGNLICPADFYLGESLRLVVASVPEGDDKPLKYPLLFSVADIVAVNKWDTAGAFDFNYEMFVRGVKAVNANAPVIKVSGKSREGLTELLAAIG